MNIIGDIENVGLICSGEDLVAERERETFALRMP